MEMNLSEVVSWSVTALLLGADYVLARMFLSGSGIFSYLDK